MNRNQEYLELRGQLEHTPAALEYTLERARARYRHGKKIGYLFGIPVTCVLAVFTAFVLLVNLSAPFAMACDKIPVLRELAEAVRLSPSLTAAVENDFVQQINQKQTSGKITMTVKYLIVDQKQVNIFFTLESKEHKNLYPIPTILAADGSSVKNASWSMSTNPYETLRCVTVDFINEVPGALRFACSVGEYDEQTGEQKPDRLAAFDFALEFDPAYTAAGETMTLKRDFVIDGQKLTVTTVEIYPTHVRVNLTGDEANTAWLKGLDFHLEDENGRVYGPIKNGIVATGDAYSPAMVSFRLDSPYFAGSKKLTLHIIGAAWLDKDMERIEINLAEKTASALPEGVRLITAEKTGGIWTLVFEGTLREKNHYFELFGMPSGVDCKITRQVTSGSYQDSGGKVITADEDHFFEIFVIENCNSDTILLEPFYSRWYDAPKPFIVLTIK